MINRKTIPPGIYEEFASTKKNKTTAINDQSTTVIPYNNLKYETETNFSNLKSNKFESALPSFFTCVLAVGLEDTSGLLHTLQYAIPSRILNPDFDITSTVQVQKLLIIFPILMHLEIVLQIRLFRRQLNLPLLVRVQGQFPAR